MGFPNVSFADAAQSGRVPPKASPKKEGGGGPWESTALMCGSVWNTVPCSRRKRVTVAVYVRGLGLRYSLTTLSTVVSTVSCSKHRGHPSTTYRGCQPFLCTNLLFLSTTLGRGINMLSLGLLNVVLYVQKRRSACGLMTLYIWYYSQGTCGGGFV